MLSYPIFQAAALGVVIRLANVYSAYKLAALYAEWKSSNSSLDINAKIADGCFFVRHGRHIQNPKHQGLVFLFHTAIQLLVWVPVAMSTDQFSAQAESATGVIILLLYGFPICYLAVKIIPLNDGLFLREEIVLILCAYVFGVILYVLLRLLVPTHAMLYVDSTVVLIAPILFVLIVIGFPLYKSYVWQRELKVHEALNMQPGSFNSTPTASSFRAMTNGNRSTNKIEALDYAECHKERQGGMTKLTLKQVLASPDGVEAFKEFCTLELNHESILFFLDAREFCDASKHTDMSKELNVSRAKHLYEKYVKPGAPLEINIGDSLKKGFAGAGLDSMEAEVARVDFKQLDKAIKDAREEVFELMATDAFVRFLRHRLYRELIHKKQKDNSKKKLGLSILTII